MRDPGSKVKRIRELAEDAFRANRAFHQCVKIENTFVWKLRQFLDDTGQESDAFLVQPRSEYPFRRVRFKQAQLCTTPPYIECLPEDDQSDPEDAELGTAVLHREVHGNFTGYMDAYIDIVGSGLTSRRGCMAVDWNEHRRRRRYRFVSPRNLVWPVQFKTPHDPDCQWVCELRWVPRWQIEEALKTGNWKKVAADLPAENSSERNAEAASSDSTLTFSTGGTPEMGTSEAEGSWLYFWWERYIFDKVRKPKPNSAVELEDDDRYLFCTACEYESESQGALGFPLPEVDEWDEEAQAGGCPECRAPLALARSLYTEIEVDAYQGGKMLTICTADESSEEEELFSGDWPFPSARSFPFMVWNLYSNPEEPWGPSETALMWTNVMAQATSLRVMLETVYDGRDITLFPKSGITNLRGEAFDYSDARELVGYYQGTYTDKPIHRIKGAEVPASLISAYTTFTGDLRANEGSSDVGFLHNPERSADVAVGTVNQMIQTGDVPLEMMRTTLNLAHAQFLAVVLDVVRDTTPLEEFVRVFPSVGEVELRRFKGKMIPRFDVRISDSPASAQVKRERFDAMQILTKTIDPDYWEAAAEFANLPPSVLRKLQEGYQRKLTREATVGPGTGSGTSPASSPPGAGPQSGAGGPVPPIGPGLESASPEDIEALIASSFGQGGG